MNISILKKEFFKRKTPIVALELLGKYLVRKYGGKEFVYTVPEVEVYAGHKDRASHARSGMTKRNFIMYGGSGVWYVYLVYGMHEMLNIVTGETDYPAAILIRGVEEISGPGRVTKQLHVKRSLNAKHAKGSSGLWFEDRGKEILFQNIIHSERVGVAYAGPKWATKR